MEDKKFKLKTPILYLTFNRLDSVKKTFPEIQRVKPEKLFVSCDGPRTKTEKRKTDAVRKYILENINWKCEVKTLFRDKNMGCREASNSAISWFFNNVDDGIMLEDDTLPGKGYFRFMQEMLERYRHNKKVMSISGYNPIKNIGTKDSYYFSRYFYSWGPAMWKRSWVKQDLTLKKYMKAKEKGELKKYFPNIIERILWRKRVGDMIKGRVSSWSYCFNIAHILNDGLCISPRINLIKNIGFDGISTHTKNNKIDVKLLSVPSGEMIFPLIHPKKVELDKKISNRWLLIDAARAIFKKIFFI